MNTGISARPGAESATPGRGLDRRQLLTAGAWAAPAILLTAAVPAATASTVPVSAIELTSTCVGAPTPSDPLRTRHGFTVENTSTQSATVIVTFSAKAKGVTNNLARGNVVSATTGGNDFPVATTGGGSTSSNYRSMWAAENTITVAGGGFSRVAGRTGVATFILPAGASVTLLQRNTNAFGEARVTAVVSQINGQAVTGAAAQFAFAVGGGCTA